MPHINALPNEILEMIFHALDDPITRTLRGLGWEERKAWERNFLSIVNVCQRWRSVAETLNIGKGRRLVRTEKGYVFGYVMKLNVDGGTSDWALENNHGQSAARDTPL